MYLAIIRRSESVKKNIVKDMCRALSNPIRSIYRAARTRHGCRRRQRARPWAADTTAGRCCSRMCTTCGRRGDGQGSSLAPRVLGWGEWKRADPAGAVDNEGDHNVSATGDGRNIIRKTPICTPPITSCVGFLHQQVASWTNRRSWCSRLRLWVRLWIMTFFRRVPTIGENASCKKGD
jgi:hypothetical protein